MRLREFMQTNVVTIESTEAASAAWSRMRQRRIRHLVVTDEGRLVGVVSERDLGGKDGEAVRKSKTVQDLMSPKVVSASPQMTLRQAANLMRGRLIGCLPVLDEDRVVGIVTATDVLDELGRGFTRPTVRARRRPLRSPPPDRTRVGSKAVRRRSQVSGQTGRARLRDPDSKMRSPLPGSLPKATKRHSGRPEAAQIPAYIRATGVELGPDDRAYIRRKLGMKLGKFATSIERVSVRVKDVNGPRGGVDKSCRIKVVLSGLPSVLFASQNASLHAAADAALAGVERVVRRTLQRRRTKPFRVTI